MRKYRKLSALILVFVLLFQLTGYAGVILSDRPFGEATGNGTALSGGAAGPGSAAASGNTAQTAKNTKGADVSTAPGAQAGNTSPSANGTTGNGAKGPGSQGNGTGGKGNGTAAQIVIDGKIAKPQIASETAVLYDATTDQVLFDKNSNVRMYPASITKVMTALLSAENLSPKTTFVFTDTATKNLESGYTNVQMTTGDTMTVEDALYALLLKSACEVANGLAEAVSGSQTKFADLMNKKALELGCKNTNFRNASGLNDTEHCTTAYDMALITKAAMANDTVRKIMSSKSWTLPATAGRGQMALSNSNKMLYSGNTEYFEGIIGGKTGYTSKAGNTLTECAEVSGHQLIAVVMKSQSKQYTDAKELLNYGKSLIAAAKGTETPAAKGSWSETAEGWKYKKAEGTFAKSEWLDIGENEYFFDQNGIMATGWKQFTNGAWYYFDTKTGAMVHDKWVTTDQVHFYYLQSNGVMATNTLVNGTYRVDSTGAYTGKEG